MIELYDKENCCGCGACYSICPRAAIDMTEDEEGFLYPRIDKNKCVGCGLCEHICPFLFPKSGNKVIESWGCNSLNDTIRVESSSGGVFSLFSECILEQGGIVFGVAMSDDCRAAVYTQVSNIKDLKMLRGSKYIQASAGEIFQAVKEKIDTKRMVLFSGTPCQVNGLKSYLGDDPDNLISVDLICHGVPSPLVWRKYIENMEEKTSSHIKKYLKRQGENSYARTVEVDFRCKDQGWENFGIKRVDSDSKRWFISKDEDAYMQFFLRDYCLRPSCYECKAKTFRHSDITIADFWGVENFLPELNDGKGTSFVIVRTFKGKSLFEKIIKNTKSKAVNYDGVIQYNTAEYESKKRPKERESFFEDLNVLSFEQMKKKYLSVSLKTQIKRFVRKTWIYKIVRK